jgi:hypothetical protein
LVRHPLSPLSIRTCKRTLTFCAAISLEDENLKTKALLSLKVSANAHPATQSHGKSFEPLGIVSFMDYTSPALNNKYLCQYFIMLIK